MLNKINDFFSKSQIENQVVFQINPFLYSSKKALQLVAGLNQLVLNENKGNRWEALNELIYSDYFEQIYLQTGKDFKSLVRLYQNFEQMKTDVDSSHNENWTKIVLGGEFSSGKSSFLNSILFTQNDGEFLPVSEKPTSVIPTFIYCSNSHKRQTVIGENILQSKMILSVNALSALGHEFQRIHKIDLGNFLKKLIIEQPIDQYYLNDIVFIDTPGYSKEDGETARDKITAIDAIEQGEVLFWVIDIESGSLKRQDIEFIRNNFDKEKPKVIIFNKADKKTKQDIESIIDSAAKSLDANKDSSIIDVLAYSSHDKEIVDSFKGFKSWSDILELVKKKSQKRKAEESFLNNLEFILSQVTRDIRKKIAFNKKEIKSANSSIIDLSSGGRFNFDYIKDEVKYYYKTACILNERCYLLLGLAADALNREIEWNEKSGMFKNVDDLMNKRNEDLEYFNNLSDLMDEKIEPISKGFNKDIKAIESYMNSKEIDFSLEFNKDYVVECERENKELEGNISKFTKECDKITLMIKTVVNSKIDQNNLSHNFPKVGFTENTKDIFQAINDNDFESFLDYLSVRRDLVEVKNSLGDNILLYAVKFKRYDMVQVLLPRAIRLVEKQNNNGDSALRIAMNENDKIMLNLFKYN